MSVEMTPNRPLITDDTPCIKPIPELLDEIQASATGLTSAIQHLERASMMLDSIHTTLMANYVIGRKIDGIEVPENSNTLQLLINVLTKYHERLAAHE